MNMVLMHPHDVPQPLPAEMQNLGTPECCTYDRYTFQVRAVPDKLHQIVADPQFTDTGESSAFPLEFLLHGVDIAYDWDIQAS